MANSSPDNRTRFSRRDFLKIAGLGLGAAFWPFGGPAACAPFPQTPQVETDPDAILEKAGMKELTEFFHLTQDLRRTFGLRILDRSVSASARDMFNACLDAVNNG